MAMFCRLHIQTRCLNLKELEVSGPESSAGRHVYCPVAVLEQVLPADKLSDSYWGDMYSLSHPVVAHNTMVLHSCSCFQLARVKFL